MDKYCGKAIFMSLYTKKSKIQGKGLFSDVEITKGDWIGSFEGRKAIYKTRFTLWVGNVPYRIVNVLKWANHSSTPNAEVDEDQNMWALECIKVGDEILWDYGEEWQDA